MWAADVVPVSAVMPTWSAKRKITCGTVRPVLDELVYTRVLQHFPVGRQQREALVEDAALAAELPHGAIPAHRGEASVLHDGRLGRRAGVELGELRDAHVGNAEEPCLAGSVQALHRLPRFPVVVAQAVTDRGPMQDVGVEVVDAEVLQRAREGLFDLRGEWCVRVIRETVVLAVDVGELRLEEDVLAMETGGSEGGGQGLADAGFVVVATLVGGVDGAKAGVEGHPHEAGGRVFLPGGAVEEGRDAHVAHGGVPCWLPVSLHGEAA